jgi:peptide/nickel transport system substrate-binding protein
VRWSAVEELKKNAPQLKWNRWLNMSGTFLAMRVDTKPFDDIRVRRALNMAVNKQEIVKAYYGGNAELFAYPHAPRLLGYYEPLERCPSRSRSCSPTTPTRPRSCWPKPAIRTASPSRCRSARAPDHMDLLPLVAAYLEKVGVKIEIQPMEYGAFLSAMTTKTNAPATS